MSGTTVIISNTSLVAVKCYLQAVFLELCMCPVQKTCKKHRNPESWGEEWKGQREPPVLLTERDEELMLSS